MKDNSTQSLKHQMIKKLCFKCWFINKSFFDWCYECKLNHFKLTSREENNEIEIDRFISNFYYHFDNRKFVKWIPYNEFKDIFTHIIDSIYITFDIDEFPKAYSATWL